MSYDMPTDIHDRVKARLDAGSYQSEDDVLRDALDALEQREVERVARWNERNALAIEQSQQKLSRPLDDQQVLARLRQRLAAEGIFG